MNINEAIDKETLRGNLRIFLEEYYYISSPARLALRICAFCSARGIYVEFIRGIQLDTRVFQHPRENSFASLSILFRNINTRSFHDTFVHATRLKEKCARMEAAPANYQLYKLISCFPSPISKVVFRIRIFTDPFDLQVLTSTPSGQSD